MDQLFAPWRGEWVKRDEDPIDGCPFCVVPDRGDDHDGRIVARGDRGFVIFNNYPYNPGHVMVVPDRHTAAYTDLDGEELRAHAALKQRTLRAIEVAFEPDGVNAGLNLGGIAAGGSVEHLHEHVVPRWTGDTNYIAVTAGTTVIAEAIMESYDRLHEAFMTQEGAEESETGAVLLPV